MSCCTRLAWGFISGPAPRLRRTPQEPAPPVRLGAQAHGRGMYLARRRAENGRVATLGATQHARAPGGGAGADPQPRLSSASQARGRPWGGARGGGPSDRGAAKRGAQLTEKRAESVSDPALN